MRKLDINNQIANAVNRILMEMGIAFHVYVPKDNSVCDMEVQLPNHEKRLCLEWHHSLAPDQLDSLKKRLMALLPEEVHVGLVVRRLTQGLLDRCRELDLSILDFSGNGYLRMPGIYFERYRPSPASTRQPSAGTGFTGKASRLVPALLTLAKKQDGLRRVDLADMTELSSGYVSILVERFVTDGYVTDRFNRIYVERPDQLLDDWVAHYRFDRHRQLHYALNANSYAQGLQKLGNQLSAAEVQYAYTGWSAAYLLSPHAEPTTLMAYVDRMPENTDALFPIEKQGNVILLLPQDNGVFQFLNEEPEAGPVVCDVQAYVDLCRMPGRAQEQADAFRHNRLNFTEKE